ncbi:hypothetical protein [Epibacterium ulvae]|uniref:hypothetical protein n=1 Tax=Epibacterium ulvae TaxID=1156985 RepID=UPI0024921E24|nr:hypothetical protein [Epibacterium ulvae]
MRLFSISALIACTASGALACPNGATQLVSCTFNDGSRYLETCLLGSYATYAFGHTDKRPDLRLARPVTEVEMTPWPGVSRYIWEDMTFVNGAVRYKVHANVDRLEQGGELMLLGGVAVSQNGRTLATLECDVGSVETQDWLQPLFTAKEISGQYYSQEERAWK